MQTKSTFCMTGVKIMIPKEMLINKPASPEIKSIAKKIFKDDDPLFAVVSDLEIDSSYGEGAIYVTKDRIVAIGKSFDGGYLSLDFVNIQKISVKRMYGNAVLKAVTTGNSTVELMRFTFAMADICDAAADFITKVNEGENAEERFAAVEGTFKNLRSFCPKCGRKLPSPNADCLNCQGKGKMAATMLRYIKPYTGKLVFCVILSVVTTVAALVPPY